VGGSGATAKKKYGVARIEVFVLRSSLGRFSVEETPRSAASPKLSAAMATVAGVPGIAGALGTESMHTLYWNEMHYSQEVWKT